MWNFSDFLSTFRLYLYTYTCNWKNKYIGKYKWVNYLKTIFGSVGRYQIKTFEISIIHYRVKGVRDARGRRGARGYDGSTSPWSGALRPPAGGTGPPPRRRLPRTTSRAAPSPSSARKPSPKLRSLQCLPPLSPPTNVFSVCPPFRCTYWNHDYKPVLIWKHCIRIL